ncbi:MAG: thiamine-phosphate kinase [Acidobacteriota bacterium]
MGEDDLVDWLRARTAGGRGASGDVEAGSPIGDDCAFLVPGLLDGRASELAATTDQQIEGVHFLPGVEQPVVARRLLAVNLSDLAAVGARPAWALVALALPPGLEPRPFLDAFIDAAADFGVELVGGDVARAERFAATATLLGLRRAPGAFRRRDEARVGDSLWLGGSVGEAALGLALQHLGAHLDGTVVHLPPGLDRDLDSAAQRDAARRAVRRHLAPRPQLELGAWLAEQPRAAVIDVSDGLARDLHRLCRASGVGAALEAEHLPLAPQAAELARRIERDAFHDALGGGEDYVLLFTLPAGIEPPTRHGARRVGRIVAEPAVELVRGARRELLPPTGFDHLA